MHGKGLKHRLRQSLCALLLSASIGTTIDGEPEHGGIARQPKVVPVHVSYDQTMLEQYGDGVFAHLRSAIAEHNEEWRKYRDEQMMVVQFSYRPRPADIKDSYYLLNKLILESKSQFHEQEHIYFIGENMMAYDGRKPRALDGLTNFWGDATIISVPPRHNRDPEYLGAVVMHETGHHFGAKDDPLPGGRSMYTWQAGKTFTIDIGNAGQIRSAPGRRGRDDGNTPYASLRARLIRAHWMIGDDPAFPLVREALLHYPSKHNPEFAAAKQRALDALAPENRYAATEIFDDFTVGEPAAASPALDAVGKWYWRADAAYRKGDAQEAIRCLENAKRAYRGGDKRITAFLEKAEENIRTPPVK